MPLKADANPKKVITALVRATVETFNDSRWRELGFLTDCEDSVKTPHYGEFQEWEYWVQDVLTEIVDKDPSNLEIVERYVGLDGWLKDADSDLHSELYETSEVVALSDLQTAANKLCISEVDKHAKRIREGIIDDPEQAVGSAKELLESVLKGIIGHAEAQKRKKIPALLKEAQRKLDLDPQQVSSGTPGEETLKQLLGSVGNIVISVCEARNLYGTGHGRFETKELKVAHARLVVNAAVTVACFIAEVANESSESAEASSELDQESAKNWQQQPLAR